MLATESRRASYSSFKATYENANLWLKYGE